MATFLQLHNKVFDRLRENRIASTDIGTSPYINSVSAFINDAKDAVEKAYEWSMLRGEDTEVLVVGTELVEIDGTVDTEYLIHAVLNETTGVWLKKVSQYKMSDRYSKDAVTAVTNSGASEWAYHYPSADGDTRIRLWPRPNATDTLRIFRVQNQAELTAHDDRLKVPSAPVQALATALASRERGEVGGATTSELFAVADTFLSDAISMDSAQFPEEQVWAVDSNMNESNLTGAWGSPVTRVI